MGQAPCTSKLTLQTLDSATIPLQPPGIGIYRGSRNHDRDKYRPLTPSAISFIRLTLLLRIFLFLIPMLSKEILPRKPSSISIAPRNPEEMLSFQNEV